MIPLRIRLTGFLSYKEEQEVDFQGSQLWMLAGMNGSGKSSIFDAVTYALFGHHRGGSIHAQELINKESRELAVEFDFSIDQKRYRIYRTLRRTSRGSASGTQQLFSWHAAPGAQEGDWQAIPDTSRKVEFDKWIRDHIGLNYETFTSSVLLLQGKAEKLLDSKPSGRAEVLAGIVDLARYQRLHERADERRKDLKRQLEDLESQLSLLPALRPEDLLLAENQVILAENAWRSAKDDLERSYAIEREAQRWHELGLRLEKLQERWEANEKLLKDAAVIEREYTRWTELKEMLPAIQSIIQLQERCEQAAARSLVLQRQHDLLCERKNGKERELQTARRSRLTLQGASRDLQGRLDAVQVRLREYEGLLVKVQLYEQNSLELARTEKELDLFADDPSRAVEEAQERLERCTELRASYPDLKRFAENREAIRTLRESLTALQKREFEIRQQGEVLSQQEAAARKQLETLESRRRDADDRVAQRRTLSEQAWHALRDLHDLEGQKLCRHCGQQLTRGHLEEERSRRERDSAEAERMLLVAIEEQRTFHTEELLTRSEYEQTTKSLGELREAYRDVRRDQEQANKELQRRIQEAAEIYDRLSLIYRERISATPINEANLGTYPSQADLREIETVIGSEGVLRQQVRAAQDRFQFWQRLTLTRERVRETLQQLEADLPKGAIQSVRTQAAAAKAEETALINQIRANRKALEEIETLCERLGNELAAMQEELAIVEKNRAGEDVTRRMAEEGIARARQQVPAAYQDTIAKVGLGEVHRWNIEFQDLSKQGVESRHRALVQVRMGRDALAEDLATLRTEREQIPPESRRDLTLLRNEIGIAKERVTTLEETWRSTRNVRDELGRQQERREALLRRVHQTAEELERYKQLAELLGRDRLQRHLVREAERQIVDYANLVLDRLSGGQLFLQLCGGQDSLAADLALELEAIHRSTGNTAINVSFLSGSQRFRVAVSLALGIGQYASRQHRPIESVIIDEGFGCLDRQGRHVMIQELQNLRGYLKCILLVSHQEEFADAFPNAYRFELHNGATQVTRIQR